MHEYIQMFLSMVDDEERPNNPVVNRRKWFLDKVDLTDERGQKLYRLGQVFMNALRGSKYYDQLSGSQYDTFYKHGTKTVHDAIDWLTTKETSRIHLVVDELTGTVRLIGAEAMRDVLEES